MGKIIESLPPRRYRCNDFRCRWGDRQDDSLFSETGISGNAVRSITGYAGGSKGKIGKRGTFKNRNIYKPLRFRIFGDKKMFIFETLAFIIGLIYGYVKHGKEKRWKLFKKGIRYGIILGIFFGIIGLFVGGLIYSAATAIGMFITVIILVVIFIIGTFIGDLLEVAIKK